MASLHCHRWRRDPGPDLAYIKLSRISVHDPVIGLGTFLTDAFVKHPSKRFLIAAFIADPKVPGIFKDTGCRRVSFGFSRGSGKILGDRPGGDGRVWSVPSNLTDEDADSTLRSLHSNKLIEKLMVVHAAASYAQAL